MSRNTFSLGKSTDRHQTLNFSSDLKKKDKKLEMQLMCLTFVLDFPPRLRIFTIAL